MADAEIAADIDQTAAQIVSALSEQGRTVAIAESLTGGMVSASLVAIAGASAVLRGAVVAYATELKKDILGVDPALLSAKGPVDPDVAAQMAGGVRELLKADYGLATTGVAGPGPADGAPAGRVFVAVAGPLVKASQPATDLDFYRTVGHEQVTARVLRLDLPGDRAAIRLGSAARVLELLVEVNS
ncbi:competence damage-inducible protein A [Kineosporia sp. NBRC 101677]|nr:competence damage-inducible protein A [Kineosporia sp. NBRC 101677]